MSLSSLTFLIQESYLNIRRNGLMSLAALGTVTVALTVLGASLWTTQRIQEIVRRQPQKFDEIDLFLKLETERAQTEALQEKVRQLAGVRAVRIVPREKAWAALQSAEPRLTESIAENPLPDKLEVEASDLTQIERLARALHDGSAFPEIEQVVDPSQEVRTMLGFSRLVRVLGGATAAGLFIATLFIVYNTIRMTVFARRREIRIMQLVGATSRFIRLPMLLEGLFHGVVGALFAGAVIVSGAREVSRFVASLHSPLVGDVQSDVGPVQVLVSLVAIGAFLGLSGSYFSLRRFLREL